MAQPIHHHLHGHVGVGTFAGKTVPKRVQPAPLSAAESAWQTLKAFGRMDLARTVGPAWFGTSDRWRRLKPKDLAWLTLAMLGGPGEDAAGFRRKAIERAWATRLDSPEAMAKMRAHDAFRLIPHIDGLLSKEQKKALPEIVREAFTGSPAAAARVSVRDILYAISESAAVKA